MKTRDKRTPLQIARAIAAFGNLEVKEVVTDSTFPELYRVGLDILVGHVSKQHANPWANYFIWSDEIGRHISLSEAVETVQCLKQTGPPLG